MPPKDKKAIIDELFTTLMKIESLEDYHVFMNDLCTPSEIDAMANRWQVAKLLSQGITYREVSMMTRVSMATVTRVARFLSYEGSGYKKYLKNNYGCKTFIIF